MTTQEQISAVPFHRTQSDLIRTVVESYIFLDFAKVVKVQSGVVDLDVGIHYKEQPFIAESVEYLSLGGGGACSLKIEPVVGDIVLVFALRSYARQLAEPDQEKKNTLKYAHSNLKAVPLSPANSDSKVLINITADGTVDIQAAAVQVNGNTDAVVLHSQLASILSTFISSLNTLFGTKMNGAGSPGTLALDITPAKSQSLKVGN